MIKPHLKTLILTSVILLLPVAVGLILWNQLPDTLPIHWNMAGEADGWCGKPFAVFGMPLILLAVQWFGMVFMLSDPKRQNQSPKLRLLSFWIVPTVSILISALTFGVAMGKEIPIDTFVTTILGLLFVIIGNYMPKCKQNYTVGIKLPWTLNNEENWNKTHRLAGRLWVVCGLLIVVAGFLHIRWFIIPALLVMSLVPMVYSFFLHRKGI